MGISVEIYRVVLLFHCFQIQLLNFITIIKTKPSGAIKRAGLCEERANIFFLSVTFIPCFMHEKLVNEEFRTLIVKM